MAFLIRPGSRVLFVGDSITDCGRRLEHRPLGNGYVCQVRDLIAARRPRHALEVLNRGIGGDTVIDLTNRWSDDVVAHQPDWVSVKVGINDAVRWERRDAERAVSPSEYHERYDQLLERTTQETDARLVLVTPFFMSRDDTGNSWRASLRRLLPAYVKAVRDLSKRHDAILVDVHRLFQQQLRHVDTSDLGDEPVHPNTRGHMVIAHAWLGALGW